jgi:ATP-dependent RNA helicase SUPV3L1/SUV3
LTLHTLPVVSEENVISFFESNVSEWSLMPFVLHRLVSFGLPSMECETLLDRFSDDVRAGSLSTPSAYHYYALERFCRPHDSTSIDTIYNTIFFAWASRDENQAMIKDKFRIRSATLHHIQRLVKATSRPFPADEYPLARKMHRKIIMHVGPTNSGKTHHALRALAAAKSGVYAGPLRLLAHEIWDRLNTGQIIPLGIDPPSSSSGTLTPTRGDPKYARPCNMLTGEERRVVDPDAKLLSCTVEMLSFYRRIEVAVIDEVQMISDPERGNGWVNAILGIPAYEIHLCGEETAVPVVQALLQHTGDEVIVRRYERLTPLVVEEKSLDGDLTKIRKGDCIVTFSRSNIFALKKAVEETTGMRCAIVYGRLPPEVRSEQATLFNDPTSGYDVIIGSDAIGMGLNLYVFNPLYSKIFRIVSTAKLSASSLRRPQSLLGVERNPFLFPLSSRSLEGQGVTVCTVHKQTWVALRPPCTLKTYHISSNVSRLPSLRCQ